MPAAVSCCCRTLLGWLGLLLLLFAAQTFWALLLLLRRW